MTKAVESRARTRRWGSRVAALLLGSVLSALLLEGMVAALFGPQVRFPRHVVGAPFGLRINEPGAVYRHKSPDVEIWFRINGQGMRDSREFRYDKPPGVRRIVVLGDSFTMGYEVGAEETYASILERELRARGNSVEALNAGVSGFGTAEQFLYLERELFRYQPDVVVLSFYTNDYSDNVRSGLFRLDDAGKLVRAAHAYVPAGRVGDFLNTNAVFNWLSAYSNAFAFVKERANEIAKREMVRETLEEVEDFQAGANPRPLAPKEEAYDRRLTVAILEALADWTRARGIPLVIQSIPFRQPSPVALTETFPTGFDVGREGVWFLPAKSFLDPYVDRELLYWTRSHGHWTPFAHARSGEALAALIASEGLLERGSARAGR